MIGLRCSQTNSGSQCARFRDAVNRLVSAAGGKPFRGLDRAATTIMRQKLC